MILSTASNYADQIVEWLTPYCERIEIAGSIRRARPEVNDIDLVVIPRTEPREEKVDMFQTEKWEANLLREYLINYICTHFESYWLPNGRGGTADPAVVAGNLPGTPRRGTAPARRRAKPPLHFRQARHPGRRLASHP